MNSLSNYFLVSAIVLTLTSACTPKNTASTDDIIAPQTGSALTEGQIAQDEVELKVGAVGYISADSVRVRTAPEGGDNAPGRLFTNDEVEVVNATPIGRDQYVEIRIVMSNSTVDRTIPLFVSRQFVSATPINVDSAATSSMIAPAAGPASAGAKPILKNRLFIVTNIATEKLRVYQRCQAGEGCVNRMIMEADVVNGQNEDGTHTNAGFFQVSSWTKFYETLPAYPAWYKAGYPEVPKPGNRGAWFQSSYMPGGKGDMRGAFGWYTIKVQPNSEGQWTHGTGGWGADKKDFITFKDGFGAALAGLFGVSVRSHGCTRIDNEAIAYLRELISVGTPLIKIYAQEAYRDSSRSMYSKVPGRWEYILTKSGAQAINNHQLADRATVLAAGTPQSEWLDQGTYSIDQYPDAASGDLYRYGSGAFQGQFLVDEGTLLNYKHPAKVGRGGFSDLVAPPYVITTNAQISGQQPASSSNTGYGTRYGPGGSSSSHGDR